MNISQIYDLKVRASRQHAERWAKIRKIAYPETGGIGLYVHNWYACGPNKDVAAMADAVNAAEWHSWHKVEALLRRWYDKAEHRSHGPRFGYLWCDYCKAERGK